MQIKLYFKIIFVSVFLIAFPTINAQTKRIDSLKLELKNAKSATAKIPILRQLSKAYTTIDLDQKYKYAKQLKVIGLSCGIDSIIALAYNDMAMVHGIKTDYDSSMYYFSMGLKTATEKRIAKEKARAYVGIGYTFDRLDNPKAAIENYKEALIIFKKLKNKQGLNQTYTNLGSLYFDMNEFKIAHSYFYQVLKSYEQMNDSAGIAYGNFILGNSSRMLNEDVEAYEYYKKSLKIRESLGDLNGIALVNFGLGELYMKQAKYDEAERVLIIAIALNKQLKNKYQEAVALLTLSKNYFNWNDIKRVKLSAKEAILKAKEVKSIGLEVKILSVLIAIEKKSENFKEGFLYQSELIVLKDSLDIEKKKNEFIYLDFQRIRNENSSLEKNNEVILSKNLIYKKAIIIITSLLIILVVLLLLYWRKVNQKNKINRILEQQRDEITSINLSLKNVIEELAVQNELVTKQNIKLERINTAKNKFFSIVFHDFRSPIATLKMLFSTYFSGQLTQEEMNILLKKLETTIFNTVDFLDNLLEWSKSQMEGLVVTSQRFSIDTLLVSNLQVLKPQLQEKKLVVENNIQPNTFVFADINMINFVFRNILSNAIKFCNEGDSIILKSEYRENTCLISIKDTGIGIQPDDLNKIFQLDYAISKGTFGEKGYHIGLVLCKDMLTRNEGNITLESTYGEGTTIFIELPKGQV